MKKDGNLKKVKNKEKHEKEEYNSYPEISNTASACECTGLMYTPPQNEEELEAYQELSDMELPGKKDSYAEDKHTSK